MKELVESYPLVTSRASRFHKNLAVHGNESYFKYIKFRMVSSSVGDGVHIQSGNFAFTYSPLEPHQVASKLFTAQSDCTMPGMVFRGSYNLIEKDLLFLNVSTEYGEEKRGWRVKSNELEPQETEDRYYLLGFENMTFSDLDPYRHRRDKNKPQVSYPTDDELAQDWGYDDWDSFSACTD